MARIYRRASNGRFAGGGSRGSLVGATRGSSKGKDAREKARSVGSALAFADHNRRRDQVAARRRGSTARTQRVNHGRQKAATLRRELGSFQRRGARRGGLG